MTFSATALFAESARAKEGKATISLSKDGDRAYAFADAGALAPPLLGGGEPAEAVGPADAPVPRPLPRMIPMTIMAPA
jgi:hypothetical protein